VVTHNGGPLGPSPPPTLARVLRGRLLVRHASVSRAPGKICVTSCDPALTSSSATSRRSSRLLTRVVVLMGVTPEPRHPEMSLEDGTRKVRIIGSRSPYPCASDTFH